MDYNNILNNKRKLNDLKNKTKSMIEKATDKISEVTTTAVDSVIDKVKNINQQQAKIGVFQDVISYINNKLIEESVDNVGVRLVISKNKQEGLISLEGILEEITELYERPLNKILLSDDYVDALFNLTKVHYKYEKEIDYSEEADIFSISVIQKNVEESKDFDKEHVCNCETECEICSCKQQTMNIEYIEDK